MKQNQAVPALTNTCSALKANPSLLLFQPVDGHQPVNVRSHLFLSVQSRRKSGTESDVFYTVVLEVMVSSAISVLRNGWGFLTFEVQLKKIASKKDRKNHLYFFHWLPSLLVFGQTHSAQLNISTHLRCERRQDTSDWFNEFPNLQAFWQRHRVAGALWISSYLDDYGIACGVFEKCISLETHSSQIAMDLGHIWLHFTDLQVPEIQIP